MTPANRTEPLAAAKKFGNLAGEKLSGLGASEKNPLASPQRPSKLVLVRQAQTPEGIPSMIKFPCNNIQRDWSDLYGRAEGDLVS